MFIRRHFEGDQVFFSLSYSVINAKLFQESLYKSLLIRKQEVTEIVVEDSSVVVESNALEIG